MKYYIHTLIELQLYNIIYTSVTESELPNPKFY